MIPEFANSYLAFTVTHRCTLQTEDGVTPANYQAFVDLSEEQKKNFFLATAQEIRVKMHNIVENAFRGHCYISPKGYLLGHIVKDLIALMAVSGVKDKNESIVFNAEKQAFWLCLRLSLPSDDSSHHDATIVGDM